MELGKLPNVIAKVSGLYGGWQGGWAEWVFAAQTGTMDFVMDSFPSTNVVVGSDWPVCEGAAPGSHATFIQELKTYVVEKRGLEYAKGLLSANALRVYKLQA